MENNLKLKSIHYNIDEKYNHQYLVFINQKKIFDISQNIKNSFLNQTINLSDKQEEILLLIAKLADDLIINF
jgi:hypothetical protein